MMGPALLVTVPCELSDAPSSCSVAPARRFALCKETKRVTTNDYCLFIAKGWNRSAGRR